MKDEEIFTKDEGFKVSPDAAAIIAHVLDTQRRIDGDPATIDKITERLQHFGILPSACSCDSAGPDSFGNFDRIPNPECPIHEK